MMGIILAIFGWVRKVYAAIITVDTVVDGNASDLAKIPKSDGTVSWNDTAKQAIQDECQDAIQGEKLDHLVGVADTDDPVNNSIVAKLASKSATADWSSFDNTTDSLEAISDLISDLSISPSTNGSIIGDNSSATPKTTTISSPSSTNTWGSWAELDASVSADVAICWITIQMSDVGINSSVIEIGVGGSGAESTIIRIDIPCGTTLYYTPVLIFPLPVPKNISSGSRLAARASDGYGNTVNYQVAVGYYTNL